MNLIQKSNLKFDLIWRRHHLECLEQEDVQKSMHVPPMMHAWGVQKSLQMSPKMHAWNMQKSLHVAPKMHSWESLHVAPEIHAWRMQKSLYVAPEMHAWESLHVAPKMHAWRMKKSLQIGKLVLRVAFLLALSCQSHSFILLNTDSLMGYSLPTPVYSDENALLIGRDDHSTCLDTSVWDPGADDISRMSA
jgi:hypothetical protein